MKVVGRGALAKRAFGVMLAMSLVAGLSGGAAAPAAASHGPVECPEIMPVDQLVKGQQATGYTVWRGKEPTAFPVEILGVLENGIGPGRDLIVIDTGGPMIEETGGIWYGMSGSPIYTEDHRLIGALAYGLSFGPSSVAGVTPAEEMVRLFDYPHEPDGQPIGFAMPGSADLPSGMRRTIASETGSDSSEVSEDMVQLKVPFSASGLSGHAMSKLRKVLRSEEAPFIPYAGASASAETAPTGTLRPGGNFAAALSYGDISFAGVGTTTYVCEGRALAFGHPFFWDGNVLIGANDADALVIVDDPTFGPYKLANVAEHAGAVDQDRMAGLRALLGQPVQTMPVTSTITNLDLDRTRTGTTEVVSEEYFPFLAFIHLLSNIDTLFDEIGQGTSTMSWTVRGTREDGTPWELSRSNSYVSEYDISWESVFELEIQLYSILYNRFEEIDFSDVDITGSVEEAVRGYKIANVLVSKDGSNYVDVRRIRVRPGQLVYLRVELVPLDESGGLTDRTVDLQVQVPDRARSEGLIEVVSGASSYEEIYCFLFGERCADEFGNKIETFDEMLEYLANRPKNNELIARLRMGGRGKVVSRDSEILDQVVKGWKRVRVRVVGGSGGGGEAIKYGGG